MSGSTNSFLRNSSTTPYTRSQARKSGADDPFQTSHSAFQPLSPALSKKRRRQPEFTIFVDSTATPLRQSERVPKKPKTGARTPLSVRSDAGNRTPLPSPRLPATPFPFSPDDASWENIENIDPNPPPMTPPPPPGFVSPRPTPPAGPPPPPQALLIAPSTIATRARDLPPPQNMVLYELLGVNRWTATKVEILAAWRQVALEAHPDHYPEDEREAATEKMQKINAAKEVLSNRVSRHRYHLTGELPWAEESPLL
ncbi:hypothetical protein BKA63DRAFT_84888 [Paraphoma chrysanthemicola]|nr:hypothetical protein BKA63DRAFT_84888 [Paraphoma chrysanthemicola]